MPRTCSYHNLHCFLSLSLIPPSHLSFFIPSIFIASSSHTSSTSFHFICIQIYTHALLHIIVVVKYRFLVIFLVFTVSICLPRPRKTNSLDVLPPQDIPDCRESIGIVRLSSLRHSPRHRLCRRLLVRHEN